MSSVLIAETLCRLCDLRASVVSAALRALIHHRDTENTEGTQRNLIPGHYRVMMSPPPRV